LDWATSQGVLSAEFSKAHSFAVDMYHALQQDETKRFFAAQKVPDLSWAEAISDLNLADKIGQTISKKEDLAGVQIFCEALLLGLCLPYVGSRSRVLHTSILLFPPPSTTKDGPLKNEMLTC